MRKDPVIKRLQSIFLKACDGFITMSEKVLNDLRNFEKT